MNLIYSFMTRWVESRETIQSYPTPPAEMHLIVAGGDALLVVGRRLIVGVDDGVRSHTVGVVRLSPGVDGVNIRNILENSAKEGEHFLQSIQQKIYYILISKQRTAHRRQNFIDLSR